MIRAFIFDLDGTLIDSEILWVEAYQELLGKHGHTFSEQEALAIVYGKAFQTVHAETLRRCPQLAWGNEEMAQYFRAVYRELASRRDLRIPGSIALLQRLAVEHPVCLVSGSCRLDVDEGVRLAGIGAVIRFSLSSEDYRPGKPEPAGFLLAARRLGVQPKDCLVFEDSTAGVRAAKAAGMHCVALARPGRPPQEVSQADVVMDDLSKFSLNGWGELAATGD